MNFVSFNNFVFTCTRISIFKELNHLSTLYVRSCWLDDIVLFLLNVYLITYFFNVDYLSNVIYLTLDESMLFLILYVDNFNVMLKIFKSEF